MNCTKYIDSIKKKLKYLVTEAKEVAFILGHGSFVAFME